MFDDISRLYYFGTRHYAIEIGRFISPDPLIFMNFSRAITNPLAGIKSLKFEKTLKYKVRELYDMLHHHK